MAGQVKPIPVPVILAAVNGDEDALAAVVAHYQKSFMQENSRATS